jgi:serine/threonine protein kinase/Flp pilus assembly protein TadD
MKPSERWQEVKEILYPALEMEAGERVSFLDQKCGDDGELRREIESLLRAHNNAAERFESPAVELMAPVVSNERADGMVGSSLGHYEIVEKLGAGGMGEVYLAHDGRLDRKVALKILPVFFTQDPDRLRRFQQEARAASALNHPNILTVHEIGNIDSVNYIATEFVDGETLRDRMNRTPLKISEALDVTTQVTSALATAHEAGIIHRDIKPENVMLRRDGIVKVLDFGLAKLASRPNIDLEASTMVNTGEGIVMGTAQYMSPEQARAIAVDARTDIWSLGCVLYEMLARRSPFDAPTAGDVVVSVLEREPSPVTRFAPEIPSELDWIVKKALRKERDERYQTGKELLSDLRSLRHRLDFEAEVERTASPDLRITGVTAQQSDQQPATETIKQPIAPPTSSAEYLIIGIRRHKTVAFVVLAALLISSASAAFFFFNREPALTEKDDILLADITNTTGDSVFDGTLKQALAVQLGQSPFLNIFPEDRVRETLRYMGRSPDERVTREIAREICQREGLTALLVGSIASLGSHYVITLETLNSQTGDALAREQVEAESKEQVISKLGEAATKLREKLGESLASIRRFDTPLAQATTSSLEALKAYTLGRDLGRKGKYIEAVLFLKRAAELDPNFAAAYASLALMHTNSGEDHLAAGDAERAFELRGRTSEREKFFISNMYYTLTTQEIDKSTEGLELWKQTYPRDAVPRNNLSRNYALMGQYDKAVEEAGEAIRLEPNRANSYTSLAVSFLCLNRFDEARAIFEQAVEKKLDPYYLHAGFYPLAFVQGDEATMQRQVDWAKGNPFEGVFFSAQAHAAAFSGQRRKSQELFRRSAEINDQYGLKESAAWGQAECGFRGLSANERECRERP